MHSEGNASGRIGRLIDFTIRLTKRSVSRRSRSKKIYPYGFTHNETLQLTMSSGFSVESELKMYCPDIAEVGHFREQ